ncbi:MAG: GspE/PulE family protein [Candidatus Uhrbacteria bacterium]
MSTDETKEKVKRASNNTTVLPNVYPEKKDIDILVKKAAEGKKDSASVQLFTSIMLFAHASRASDVHIEVGREQGSIRYRIDGILQDLFVLPTTVQNRLISLIKILTHMHTDEHRAPQDGRYQFSTPKGDVDVRASIIPCADGEKAVLRLLSSESHKLSLEQLGFSPTDLAKVQKATRRPWGMILATGPTGSGKTTSIYAILETLNTRDVNISTIEDPIEFHIEGINQSQVDQVAKLTFANGLRALLRQDPDIIMVGEIRDEETAEIAVNAALTGHKLLSTLHTNNAAAAIPRLIDMGVEPFLLASTLSCAIAQRLMRRVCTNCGEKFDLQKTEVEKILGEKAVNELFGDKTTVQVIKSKGCDKCNNTGYHGRVGIYEVMEMSEELQKLAISRVSSEQIENQAIKEGMTSLLKDGVAKVLGQETTFEELVRVMRE